MPDLAIMNKINIGCANNMNLESYNNTKTKLNIVNISSTNAQWLMSQMNEKLPFKIMIESGERIEFNGQITEYEYGSDKTMKLFVTPSDKINHPYCPEHLEMINPTYTYKELKGAGWTDQQMVNEGHARWLFKAGDWVWCCDTGWVQLKSNFDDDYPLIAGDYCSINVNGYQDDDAKFPQVFKFDPLSGTTPPAATVDNNPTIPEWLKKMGSPTPFHSITTENLVSVDVDLDGIVDNLDFESILSNLIEQGYGCLRGGQKADGTWYLSGNKNDLV